MAQHGLRAAGAGLPRGRSSPGGPDDSHLLDRRRGEADASGTPWDAHGQLARPGANRGGEHGETAG